MYNRKLCCKVPVVGPAGPQGATGPQGPAGEDAATDNALLFFQDVPIPAPSSPGTVTSDLLFDISRTDQHGFGASKYLNDSTDASSSIIFSSVPADHYIEIYAFCSVVYQASSTDDSFLRLELHTTSNGGVQSIIDGRTIRGAAHTYLDKNYLAFGPAAFPLASTEADAAIDVISKQAHYRLRFTTGSYGAEVSNVRLVIKARKVS
jgi:hypothetical protein